jgi:hypothetical protein
LGVGAGQACATAVVSGAQTQDTIATAGVSVIDTTNVSRIHAVVIDGRLLDRAQLDATLARVKQQFQ